MVLRIGIDVGGTFTDFLVMEAGAANRIHKVLSTPDDPSIAVIDGLAELAGERGQGLREFFQSVDIDRPRHDGDDQCRADGQDGAHRAPHDARLSRRARDAARHARESATTTSTRRRSRWCRARCGCRCASGSTADGAIVTGLDLDDVELRRRSPAARRRSRRSRSASCTRTPIAAHEEAAARRLRASHARRLSLGILPRPAAGAVLRAHRAPPCSMRRSARSSGATRQPAYAGFADAGYRRRAAASCSRTAA